MNYNIKSLRWPIMSLVLTLTISHANAQRKLSLADAIELGTQNYELIKSKEALSKAAKEDVRNSKTLYLPEFSLSAQQYYGTANALHGPQYGFPGGITSTGMPQPTQNWDAAFSSLYLASFNWNVYSFGARKNSVSLSNKKRKYAEANLDQEVFQHQIKTASAYLNLLAIRKIIKVQQHNVERAKVLVETTQSLTTSGLKPAVDLSTSEAELAGANIALLKAQDKESLMLKELVVLLGIENEDYLLDEAILQSFPAYATLGDDVLMSHPTLRAQDVSVDISKTENKVIRSQALPQFNLVGSIAGRGSGFHYDYAQNNANLSRGYTGGVGIERGNYLLGINLSWNITSFVKSRSKSAAQQHITQSKGELRDLTYRELSESFKQATMKIAFARNQYTEVLKQVDATKLAYQQYSSLYKNGLATIDELVQSMYKLSAVESDCAVIQINVWQAYLLQVATSGNIEEFMNQIKL